MVPPIRIGIVVRRVSCTTFCFALATAFVSFSLITLASTFALVVLRLTLAFAFGLDPGRCRIHSGLLTDLLQRVLDRWIVLVLVDHSLVMAERT